MNKAIFILSFHEHCVIFSIALHLGQQSHYICNHVDAHLIDITNRIWNMSDYLLGDIGHRLRERRKAASLTLAELATHAGVSKSLLSKIENGRTVPSLPVLLGLIKHLGLTPEVFFQGMQFEPRQTFIHRTAADFRDIDKEEDAKGFRYQRMLSEPLHDMAIEAVLLAIAPGSQRAKVTTDAWEFKYVIQGELEYHIGNETIVLSKGDVLFYDGRIPHVPVNRGMETALLLVLYFYDKHES